MSSQLKCAHVVTALTCQQFIAASHLPTLVSCDMTLQSLHAAESIVPLLLWAHPVSTEPRSQHVDELHRFHRTSCSALKSWNALCYAQSPTSGAMPPSRAQRLPQSAGCHAPSNQWWLASVKGASSSRSSRCQAFTYLPWSLLDDLWMCSGQAMVFLID